MGEADGMGRGDVGQREDGWGDGEEHNSWSEVGSMGTGDPVQREDGWGDGDGGSMGRGGGEGGGELHSRTR